MRIISYEDAYYSYLEDYYSSPFKMRDLFNHNKKIDKAKVNKNKTYLVSINRFYYLESDVLELLTYKKEQFNTIVYAQQLIVDFEAIFDYLGIKAKAKFSRILKIDLYSLDNINFRYNTAVKIIENLKKRLMEISPEARQEIRYLYEKVSQ